MYAQIHWISPQVWRINVGKKKLVYEQRPVRNWERWSKPPQSKVSRSYEILKGTTYEGNGYPSWEWCLQVILIPWATKSRGRDFFKGGRFVAAWFSALFFFFLIYWFLLCFSFWSGSVALPPGKSSSFPLPSGSSFSKPCQDHVTSLLSPNPNILSLRKNYFSLKE